MFSKNSKGSGNDAEQQSAKEPSAPSIISADLKIIGDLSCEGEIQVDGSVDGDIRSKSLIIGESAKIKGEVVAETVFVYGSVTGQIKSREVNLAKTAHVVGDILHEILAIETGAFMEGHCIRMVEKTTSSDGKVNVFGSEDANRRLAKIKDGGVSANAAKDDTANAGNNPHDTKAAV